MKKHLQQKSVSETRSGLIYMVSSCFFFALMSALVYQSKIVEPAGSIFVASFVRILTNLIFVVLSSLFLGRASTLLGDGAIHLWLRGLFGSISLIAFFYAINTIGVAEASFLQGGSGVWVAMFAPFVLRRPNSQLAWFAILAAIFGLYLLYQPKFDDLHPLGRFAGLLAGLASAVAYLMIAKMGSKNSSFSVVFYFCMVGTLIHLAGLFFFSFNWPKHFETYLYLIGGGIAASLGQMVLTKAYQMAPAALCSAVGYCTQVFNLIVGVAIFGEFLGPRSIIGALIVLFGGVVLPFLNVQKTRLKEMAHDP